MSIEEPTSDLVVAIAKDRCGHGNGVAENSFCGIATAVDLRLDFFDNDASPAFNRFHITQVFRVRSTFLWYPEVRAFPCVSRKLKVMLSVEDAHFAAGVAD